MQTQSKGLTWSGRILTAFIVAMLIMSATFKITKNPIAVTDMTGKFAYPENTIVVIGVVELVCALIFAVPQTAVLGAVLLTGYLGGAVATHVRVSDAFVGPVVGGVLVWLALFLRDPRIRALLPIRRSN
jgi:hypothetical protein